MGDLIKAGREIIEDVAAIARMSREQLERVLQFASQELKYPVRVAIGMLGDQLYAWQVGNRIRILDKVRAKIEERGVPIAALPAGFVLDALESAQRTDEPELQELWAELLVGAMGAPARAHPLYVDTLRRLSVDDARLFRRIVEESAAPPAWDAIASKGLRALANVIEPEAAFDRLEALDLAFIHNAVPQGLAHRTRYVGAKPIGRQFARAVGLDVSAWEA